MLSLGGWIRSGVVLDIWSVISGKRIQLLRNLIHYGSLGEHLKEGPQWVSSVVFITCNTVHSISMCLMVRVWWPQCLQFVGGPRDKIWDFVALVWPILSWVITTSLALVRCLNFFGGPSVGHKHWDRTYHSLIDDPRWLWYLVTGICVFVLLSSLSGPFANREKLTVHITVTSQ